MTSAVVGEVACGGGESEADRLTVVARDQILVPLLTLALWLEPMLDPNMDVAATGELG